MTFNEKILEKIDKINQEVNSNLIISGFTGLLAPAFNSVFTTRALNLFKINLKQLEEEIKTFSKKVNNERYDKDFLESDEFTSLVLNIISLNGRTHEKEKIKYFAIILVNSSTIKFSKLPYKEGFINIIDELSIYHINILSTITNKHKQFTVEDINSGKAYVSTKEIAKAHSISEGLAIAYCTHLIKAGLLREWDKQDGWHGGGVVKGNESINLLKTEYCNDFCKFLELQVEQ